VSWIDCTETGRQLGLVLPTEAQWEYACRAGTTTSWHTGDTVELLRGYANIADEGSAILFRLEWPHERDFDDGHAVHAPVGSFLPNRFGLHDMHGNVAEWCRDEFASYRSAAEDGDGFRNGDGSGYHVYRGGHFTSLATLTRSAVRGRDKETHLGNVLGCRLAMAVQQ
jgi:formylglycine-generating enzyme required for sulfatase activity